MNKNFYFTQTTTMTATKIKAEAKQNINDILIEKLSEVFGEENVQMVRTGSNDSKKNEIAVRCGTVLTVDGDVPISVTINVSAKPYTDSPASAKRSYTAFDFEGSVRAYDDYLTDKATKQAERKATKNEGNSAKIAAKRKTQTENIDSEDF